MSIFPVKYLLPICFAGKRYSGMNWKLRMAKLPFWESDRIKLTFIWIKTVSAM